MGEQWYTNKELFEKIMDMQKGFEILRQEMKETREIIRKYNGLRQDLYDLQIEFHGFQERMEGRSAVAKGIREWGGWVVAILSFLFNFFLRG